MNPFAATRNAGRKSRSRPGVVALVVLLFAGAVIAQPAAPQPLDRRIPQPISFARFVPSSARIFITVFDLDRVDAALRETHAWQLMALTPGGAAAGSASPSLASLAAAMRPDGIQVRPSDLTSTEFGLAAHSWSTLPDGVWYVRVPDEDHLDRFVPKDDRRTGRLSAASRLFRLDSGTAACVNGDALAFSRRAGPGTLYRETLRLMGGRTGASLAETPEYAELFRYLPGGPLATAYLSSSPPRVRARAKSDAGVRSAPDDEPGGDSRAGPAATTPSAGGAWWPAMSRAVLGMYARDGRVELAARARLVQPSRRRSLSEETLRRFRQLPQTTLFALGTTTDFKSAVASAANEQNVGLSGRYARFLEELKKDSGWADAGPDLGPDALLVWDQDIGGTGQTPQVAVLIHCQDARAANEFAGRLAQALMERIHVVDPVAREDAPAIRLSSHLGTAVSSVPLARYADHSRFPAASLFRNLEPAWAAQGPWLIFALTRRHLERLLDADAGLAGQLGAGRDLPDWGESRGAYHGVAFLQGALAAGVINDWVGLRQSGERTLLDPSWWTQPIAVESAAPEDLGFVAGEMDEPGAVVVHDVFVDDSATGKLIPGDRIIGLDGQLLDWMDPSTDFLRRWSRESTTRGRRLRVLREGRLADVVLVDDREPPPPPLPIEPSAALSELASIVGAVTSVHFALPETDADHFAAFISARLVPQTGASGVESTVEKPSSR